MKRILTTLNLIRLCIRKCWTYWRLLAQGHASNVLEYPGDIKTQQTDSTRLRIGLGTAGQLLKVNTNGLTHWEDFEVVQKVFHGSPKEMTQ